MLGAEIGDHITRVFFPLDLFALAYDGRARLQLPLVIWESNSVKTRAGFPV